MKRTKTPAKHKGTGRASTASKPATSYASKPKGKLTPAGLAARKSMYAKGKASASREMKSR